MKHRIGLVALILAGCDLTPLPDPVSPDNPTDDVAVSPAAACQHLRDLGCLDGQPTPAGTPCDVVLADVAASPAARISVPCLARIKACSEEAACAR